MCLSLCIKICSLCTSLSLPVWKNTVVKVTVTEQFFNKPKDTKATLELPQKAGVQHRTPPCMPSSGLIDVYQRSLCQHLICAQNINKCTRSPLKDIKSPRSTMQY